MPRSRLDFEGTMQSLNLLVDRAATRRADNMRRLAGMSARLDDPLFSDPSSVADPRAMSRSSQTPMNSAAEPEAASDAARAQLPTRTTRGGPFGDSVVERVLASYDRS